MKHTRYVRDNQGNFIAEYEVLDDAEREILVDGVKVPPTTRFPVEEERWLNELIDDFEEGFNEVKDGYEYLSFNKFTVRRKIGKITKIDGVKKQ